MWSFYMIDSINIVSCADDNTPFASGHTPLNFIISFEIAAEKRFEWFTNNQMKVTVTNVICL